MQLILVRHGQTDSNLTGALDTAYPGASLNATGRAQARELVESWFGAGLPRPSVIACSALQRTKQTATPLASHFGLTIIEDDGFREINAGSLEMATSQQAQLDYLEVLAQWVQGNLEAHLPGAPNGHEVLERFHMALDRVISDAKAFDPQPTVVVVCHGAIIRAFAAHETPEVTLPLIAQHPLPNTAWAVLEGEPGQWHTRIWACEPVDSWSVDPHMTQCQPSSMLLKTPHLDEE
ncbi:MAG: histidine phosphatase family protein [Actinomycetaceae bacterium]|nr:histidine phosphatase family protein [Actinomycetaceae bacterium]